ncbi:SGNH/GDSL hydrolase family protein [Bradyrhizobium erythrophlei]|uniref:Lysophospholipase L1 n=1 Tax=Bradyrhizobium erythrophlei TaxID=1437360 RepID=A0A1M5NNT3_9BRAD|nr:SGNH/GDSL hydrolase family protein [Bradyrhizobium erythrophlei]SHG91221.1 Lysophospholipase L1 [Bradyrhizobium erythrophlei]
MTTHRLIPPAVASKVTLDGRVYDPAAGGQDVPDYDSMALQANGWSFLAVSGPTSARPHAAVGPYPLLRGTTFWDTSVDHLVSWDGATWRDENGNIPQVTFPLQARMVGLGDSIMAGSVGPSLLNPALYYSGGRFYLVSNQGVGGSTTVDMLSRNATTTGGVASTLTLSPDVVDLHIGTNDITGLGSGAAAIFANIQAIVSELTAGGVKAVFVHTVLPRSDSAWTAAYETVRQALNASIMTLQYPAIPVNLETIGFNSTIGVDTVEGLHPNRPGAWLVGSAVGAAWASKAVTNSVLFNSASDWGNLLVDNDMTEGTAGVLLGTGTTGSVPTGWNAGVNVTGMTTTCSIATKNGFPQMVANFSGTPGSSGILLLYRDQAYSGNIGDVYDCWADVEMAGLTGVGGTFFATDGVTVWEASGNALGQPPNFNGIMRGGPAAPLTAARTVSRFQFGVYLESGVACSGTIKLSRCTWRKNPSP